MRGKASQIKSDEDQYGYRTIENNSVINRRLNVNDLLRRAKEEKKIDKKTNFLILSSTLGLAAVVLLILSF